MNEASNKGKSIELTTKGKIILGVVAILIIAAIIFFVVNKNNSGSKSLEGARLAITITPDRKSGSSITFSPGNETTAGVTVGGQATLTYSFDKETDSKVRWVVSDTSIAKEENGVLTALKAGTVDIYAVAVDNENIKSNTVSLSISK